MRSSAEKRVLSFTSYCLFLELTILICDDAVSQKRVCHEHEITRRAITHNGEASTRKKSTILKKETKTKTE